MYLLAPFILQNFKKIHRADPELQIQMCHFRDQNGPFVMNKTFLVQTIIITFIYLLALFTVQNLKKFLPRISRVLRMCHFWGQNGPFAPNKSFFWKIINIILIYLLAPLTGQNFKKILPALWGCAIFGPKMAHFPKWEFFSEDLLISLVSFIHDCLHAKNQSQIIIY